MLNSPIIQVAIGMIFVYSLLSLLVSQINSLVVNALNLRGKQLKEGLVYVVNDKELQAKLLAHPLIRMVEYRQVSPQAQVSAIQADQIVKSEATRVTYIPPSTFVEALISLLTAESDYNIYKPLIDGIDALPNTPDKVRLREMLRQLRSFQETNTSEFRHELLDMKQLDDNQKQILSYALEQVEDALGRLPAKNGQLVPLWEGIRKLDPKSPFKGALETVLITAQSLEDARGKLQNWFNDGMARISDIYKRRLQLISLIVGALLALVLNADTLHLARTFWEDPALRQTVVEAARQNLQSAPPAGDTTEGLGVTPAPEGTPQEAFKKSVEDVEGTVQSLLNLQLPIGWELIPVTDDLITTSQAAGLPNPLNNQRNLWNLWPGNNAGWLGMLLLKLIGIGLTAVAVAQGAPFWFDLLNRLTGRKSASEMPPPAPPTINLNVGVDRLPKDGSGSG